MEILIFFWFTSYLASIIILHKLSLSSLNQRAIFLKKVYIWLGQDCVQSWKNTVLFIQLLDAWMLSHFLSPRIMLGFSPHTHNRILLAMKERANNQENCIDKEKLQRLGSRHSRSLQALPTALLSNFFLSPLLSFSFLFIPHLLTQPQRSQWSLTESSSA